MKKLIFTLILILGLVPMALAFNISGEDMSPAATSASSSDNSDQVHAALARIEDKLNKKSVAHTGGSERRIKQSMLQHAKYADNKAAEHALGLHNHMSESFWITLVAILVAAIIIISVGVFFYRRIQRDARGFFPRLWNTAGNNLQVATDTYRATEIVRNTSAEALELMRVVNAKVDESLAKNEAGFNAVNSGIADARNDIANLKKLDPSDFIFEAGNNHVVTYKSPAEGIDEGYYLRIYVPKDMVGDPATYCRDTESNRGVVNRELKKIMAKFFRGEFNAPEYALQKALIEYLNKNGELTWRTL